MNENRKRYYGQADYCSEVNAKIGARKSGANPGTVICRTVREQRESPRGLYFYERYQWFEPAQKPRGVVVSRLGLSDWNDRD